MLGDDINLALQHRAFMTKSDRRSLYTQIRDLVELAKTHASEELGERRYSLQELLEYEDKIYEEEFANKVKSRIDEDIKERKNVLLKIKELAQENELAFLKAKRVQQEMECCNEVREALQRKEMNHVKTCQLEQIAENERKQRRAKELDKYWQRVECINMQLEDKRQEQENCIKRKLQQSVKDCLDIQLQEHEWKREEERREKAADSERLNKLLEEIRIEDFDRQLARGVTPKAKQYRLDLLATIEEKKKQRCAEETQRAEEHLKMIEEMKRLDLEDTLTAFRLKRELSKATLEYLDYVQRMRRLEEGRQRMFDARTDDLRHVDICTKQNIKRELERKAEIAARCYAQLQKQICEEYSRRKQEEIERREPKIIENRFVHNEITREEILDKRRKYNDELNKQIELLKKIRAEEEAKYKNELTRAVNDPEMCAQLAEKYIKEGMDCLEPHPNWRILACPKKQYMPKPPQEGADVNKPLSEEACTKQYDCKVRECPKKHFRPMDYKPLIYHCDTYACT